MSLNGVGMDAIVDLGEVSLDVPAESLSLFFLEALEFLDEIELELDYRPRRRTRRRCLYGRRCPRSGRL